MWEQRIARRTISVLEVAKKQNMINSVKQLSEWWNRCDNKKKRAVRRVAEFIRAVYENRKHDLVRRWFCPSNCAISNSGLSKWHHRRCVYRLRSNILSASITKQRNMSCWPMVARHNYTIKRVTMYKKYFFFIYAINETIQKLTKQIVLNHTRE
jgi:hypothetical protein